MPYLIVFRQGLSCIIKLHEVMQAYLNAFLDDRTYRCIIGEAEGLILNPYFIRL